MGREGTFYSSVGGASEKAVQQYIETQKQRGHTKSIGIEPIHFVVLSSPSLVGGDESTINKTLLLTKDWDAWFCTKLAHQFLSQQSDLKPLR